MRIEVLSPTFTKYHINDHHVIHHFTGPDASGPHDHPWSFRTRVLSGWYKETIYSTIGQEHEKRVWREDSVHEVKATDIHRITHVAPEGCVTFVEPGPFEQEWGFFGWRDGQFVKLEK